MRHLSHLFIASLLLLTTSLTACAEPINPTEGMRLVFAEEFNGKLNKELFTSGMPWDAPSNPDNGNLNMYQESAVDVSGGNLKLWAKKPKFPVFYKNGQHFSYSSGMVQTSTSYAFRYGYVEMRAKMPAGKGLWGALWLLPANPVGKWPPEIDILEHHGDKPTKGFFSLHFQDQNGETQHDIHELDVPDMMSQYHTYGTLWEPERIVWFMDGKAIAESHEGIPNESMYLLLNLAVGGNWSGNPDASTPFPTSMDIDYIHVWQHSY